MNIEELKASKNVEGLIEALKHENSNVRYKAAVALGKIGDARAVEPLTETLKDEDWRVQSKDAFILSPNARVAVAGNDSCVGRVQKG